MCGPLLLGAIGLIGLEIFVLIELGARVGALYTILLTFVTASVGLWATKDQAIAELQHLAGGQVPSTAEAIRGPLLLLAALCLIIPGFVTDVMGALLLLPPLRRALAAYLADRYGQGGGGGPGAPIVIISKEVRRVDEPPEEPPASLE